jgi:hypothetical protein
VLLNIILFVGNSLCRYFVDLNAINLISYIATIAS